MTQSPATNAAAPLRPLDPLLLAAALGLSAGSAHVAVILFRRYGSHLFTWTSRDVVWMSPVGNVVLLLVPALLLGLAATWRSRLATWRVAITLESFIALLGAALLVRGLQWGAAVALALGAAWQLGRVGAARGPAWRRPLRAMVLGLTALTAIATPLSRATGVTAAPSGVAAAPGRPSVLLIVMDAVRRKSIGVYGSTRSTSPHLDALAQQGAVYERAFATAPWTLPSHAGMFTGRHPSELTASWRHPFDGEAPTIAERFQRAGYATGAFIGNTFYTHHESGLGRGFAVLKDFDVSLSQVLRSTRLVQTPTVLGLLNARSLLDVRKAIRYFDLTPHAEPENDRRLASEVLGDFRRWHDGLGGRPYFAFINLYDAHDPYRPPPPWDRRFGANGEARYEGGIGYMDTALDTTLRYLASTGELDHTIVIVTSDHGEQFGEHGLHNHGNSLYLPLVEVPLILRYPAAVTAGTRVHRVVSLADLPATLMQLAGMPTEAGVPGRSFAPAPDDSGGLAVMETQKTDGGGRDEPAAHGPMASLANDSLHVILNGTGRVELYQYRSDPDELRDLVATADGCRTAHALLDTLRHVSAFARQTPTLQCASDSPAGKP